jgi:hypothetical protein
MGLLDKWIKGEKPDYGLLEEMINKQPKAGRYEYSGPSFEQMFNDRNIPHEDIPGGLWESRGIYQIPTEDGYRYYFGQGTGTYDRNLTRTDARHDAITRYLTFPQDSITTEQFNRFKNYGLYE